MKRIATLLLIAVASPLSFLSTPVLADADDAPEVFSLWPDDAALPGPAPFIKGEERDLTKDEDRLIAGSRIIKLGHVASPELHVYLPPADRANGTAVVVCPGGGFSILAWDLEGTEAAAWLNQQGIAAAVLKYRVPTREHGESLVALPGEKERSVPKKVMGPLMDAQRALSLVRSRAETWRLDPDRIGILGFSAGGQTAALAALAQGQRSYPAIDQVDQAPCSADFAMLVYTGGLVDGETGELQPYVQVDENAPPMFFVHAADDRVTPLASTALFEALILAGVPAEIHVFGSGGHGYGLRPTDRPVTHWPNQALTWFEERQLLGEPPPRPKSTPSP